MAKKLIMSLLFLGCLFILFLVSVMSTGCPSCSSSNFYKTFGIGFVILLLMFYTINWLASKHDAGGLQKKILLSLGLFFLFAIFVLPQIHMFVFVALNDQTNLSDLSLGNWLLPTIFVFLVYLKFKRKKVPEKKSFSEKEVEKRKKDYEVMLNNHLITQENYERMIKQLDNHS